MWIIYAVICKLSSVCEILTLMLGVMIVGVYVC